MAQDIRDGLLIVLVLAASGIVGLFSWTTGNRGAALAVIGGFPLFLTLVLIRPRYPLVTWLGVYLAAVALGCVGLQYAVEALDQAFA